MDKLINIGLRGTYRREVTQQRELISRVQPMPLTEMDILHMPELIRNYLRKSGSLGQQKVNSFQVELTGQLRKKSNGIWMPFRSEQYNFMPSTSRLFFMDATMKHLPITGYHHFQNGVAYIDIRALALFRVQYAAGDLLNKAETVTFLNDMCCLAPATLIDPRITWKEVNSKCVHVTFTNRGISVSAHLYFNEYYELVDFVSGDRGALTDDGTFLPLRWSTPLGQHEDRFGYHLPRYAEAIYQFNDGPFTYGIFDIVKIVYNA